jgi:selenocysteine-specific elongation factor
LPNVAPEHAALTLGTAGHIDHGKTALVRALTGVDTDRLPQEQSRGMSIELGFAPLVLPSGRHVSVIDVPGHERFVRTMVAGATGIDLYLMVIAADDGVMPQTLEHAEVLAALGIEHGVVAITKADRAAPERAAAEAAELLPEAEVVACSARTGEGVADVAAALERAAEGVTAHAESRRRDGPAVLHIDRAFTIHGAGTVVTGTLWSGTLTVGDTLALLPAQRSIRVRSLQVHDEPAEHAHAGQRVAVNLAGIALRDVARGDALADPAAQVVPTLIIDAALDLRDELRGRRVMAHHGTRAAPARLAALGDGLWQVRLEAPLLAATGDRLVVRAVAPPDTLGGGTVLDPRARRHGRRPDVLARLERLRRGEPEPEPEPAAPPDAADPATTAPSSPALEPEAIELAQRLLAAGHEPLSRADLGGDAAHLPKLIGAGVAVRIGRDLYAHRDALAVVADRVGAIIAAEDAITLARLRDELGTSRKYAEALLEHLDQARVTKRLPDDRRVLRLRRR